MSVTSIILFEAKEEYAQDFEQAYLEGKVLQLAAESAGFERGEFYRCQSNPACFAAIVRWRSAQDYANWQSAYGTALNEETLKVFNAALLARPVGQSFVQLESIEGKQEHH